MTVTKHEICELIKNSPMGYTRTLSSKYKDFVSERLKAYGIQSMSELCYLFVNDLDFPKKCRCGINLKFIGFNDGYRQFCKQCYEDNRQETALKNNQPPDAPKCVTPTCNNTTYMKRDGVWADHCSLLCRGRHNSSKSSEKRKTTMMTNHGVEHALQNKEILGKLKEQNIIRYGVDNVLKIPKVQEQIKSTNFERYGVENPLSNADIRKKGELTTIDRYGVRSFLSYKAGFTPELSEKLQDVDQLRSYYDSGGIQLVCNTFKISTTTAHLYLRNAGIPLTGFSSGFEKTVKTFISENYNGEVMTHNRTILGSYELDIYLPKLRLAVECNGSYWHSELNGKDKSYHINKTKKCAEKSINLVHIWEHEWNDNTSIYKSMLRNLIGSVFIKIPARKCDVVELTDREAMSFLNENHRQGYSVSSIRYGLKYAGELVMVLTISKPRFNTNYEYELNRLCTKTHIIVQGGASKLFSRYIKAYSPKSICSYSDSSKNMGGIYPVLGFTFVENTPPNYKYTNDYLTFYNRVSFQKHKLKDKLATFDSSLTEWENMQVNGYDRIWDSGSILWEWHT